MELQERDRGQSSTVKKESEVWRSLWNLSVPNPVKIFMWRACSNILPTKQNLFKRQVVEDDRCPWCRQEEETIVHALWSCPAAQDGTIEDPNNTHAAAVSNVDEFKRCMQQDEPISSPMLGDAQMPSFWKPPPPGVIKINFDAAMNKQAGFLGIGIVARDCMGNLLGAKRLTVRLATNSHIAEFMAASHAVIFTREVGFFDVIFEGDAMKVIKEVKSSPPYYS
ncbi:uncharacterized protein LOC133860414 [Alnus glutinosa]|uniref:uncharacterized protein LOC133860414 n=1 Tax=Alnus glutinosa TaxID=3517 RepID=UPI002D76AF63|nr:uncharacterized protein LOC133860414 [Alnus glutinosa]